MFVVGCALMSRIPLLYLGRGVALAAPFAGISALSLAFAGPGGPAWRILGIAVVKACLASSILVLVMSTTRFPVLLAALERFGLPRTLSVLLSFTYRFIFVMTEEVERAGMAVASRCPRRIGRFPALARQVGLVFIRAFERSERVYQAMLARGYTGEFPGASLMHFHARDWIAMGSTGLFAALAWVFS